MIFNLSGKKLISNHLKMEDIKCYWEFLLKAYADLLKYKIKKNENFIEIISNR